MFDILQEILWSFFSDVTKVRNTRSLAQVKFFKKVDGRESKVVALVPRAKSSAKVEGASKKL